MVVKLPLKSMRESLVPISRFNKGEANKIFDEVRRSGYKVVLKNNKPACVLVSPDTYEGMLEIIDDYILLTEAGKRDSLPGDDGAISHAELLAEMGISDKQLDDVDIDFE